MTNTNNINRFLNENSYFVLKLVYSVKLYFSLVDILLMLLRILALTNDSVKLANYLKLFERFIVI